jgi:hypothetical protein
VLVVEWWSFCDGVGVLFVGVKVKKASKASKQACFFLSYLVFSSFCTVQSPPPVCSPTAMMKLGPMLFPSTWRRAAYWYHPKQ